MPCLQLHSVGPCLRKRRNRRRPSRLALALLLNLVKSLCMVLVLSARVFPLLQSTVFITVFIAPGLTLALTQPSDSHHIVLRGQTGTTTVTGVKHFRRIGAWVSLPS